ncbi:MAG TPA: LemA family protein [bacterium (Candidatus Stahlbacteria)]|nr:LemA family protein [Candidatus Stahlbacteria bacterium]
MIGWIILIIIVLAVIFIYNRLIVLRTRVKNAWAQIDVQLKRRYDLIPNLVETVKGYAKHEKEVFTQVTEARTKAMGATSTKDIAEANNMLTQTLKSLFAVVENYPDLKANANFLRLQEELTATENKISFSRQFYNDSVMIFNQTIQKFPQVIIASLFSFTPFEYFEIPEEAAAEREAPKVKF